LAERKDRGPPLWQTPHHLAFETACQLPPVAGADNPVVREVVQPAGVVVVVVRQDHGLNLLTGVQPHCLQPEPDLLDRGDLDLDHLTKEQVPPRVVARRRVRRRVPGIDEESALGALD
jgi:hypothetical protein